MQRIKARALRAIGIATLLLTAAGCSRIPILNRLPGIRPPEQQKITMDRLLDEMTDLNNLTRFPDPPYTNQQASSYDRESVSPGSDSWFANKDSGRFIRTEEREGRKENVLMDAEGPGAIVRIWSANPRGIIRFYLNGSETPSLEVALDDLLGGRLALFPEPIAGLRGAGWNLYFPIPYSKHMKVTAEAGGFYYHVNYRTYPEGTEIEDFSVARVEELKEKRDQVARALAKVGEGIASLKDAPHAGLPPGKAHGVILKGRSKQVDLMRVRVDSIDRVSALRGIVLEVWVDDEKEAVISCPVGDFFGASPGLNAYASLPLGVLADGTMYSRWPMPFRKRMEIRLTNQSEAPASVALDLASSELSAGWSKDTMHFHAGYRAEYDIPTRPFRDWNFVKVEGEGVFVGDSLAIVNPVRGWWGEGDEKIFVDGETFPSTFGTGTEDYYGYAWGSNQVFHHAYHNQPRCDGPASFGYTSINRFHVIDAIPFRRSFQFDIEVWHSNAQTKLGYAAVSYWYSKPGASSNLPRPPVEQLRVPPIDAPPIFKVEGAIEAEALKFVSTGGRADIQEMDGDGKWSGSRHVWFKQGNPGDIVEFPFGAPEAGRYEVEANFTKARDYGIAQISVNGREAVQQMDFYNESIVPTGAVKLGTFDLGKEGNVLSLKVLGANDQAVKSYMLGVDYIRLRPVKEGK